MWGKTIDAYAMSNLYYWFTDSFLKAAFKIHINCIQSKFKHIIHKCVFRLLNGVAKNSQIFKGQTVVQPQNHM